MGDCGLFKEQGRPVKFFIQKDLNEEVVKELTAQITVNGGSVEDKVPLQGFVLIDPTSGEGKRLYACWSTSDRPLRYFVPPTFVSASLQAGRIIPQPFRDTVHAERRRIHIHKSITNERIIEILSVRIWNSGGDPTATEDEADVVIAEENNPAFQDLVVCYDHVRCKFVETPAWVNECIEFGTYRNTPSIKKNLGGRVKGSRRTEFSESDDKHLAQYIGSRLPDPSMRGRTGNKIYQDLCSRIDLYPWSERHPWQSWRERYKNNTERFNRLIEFFVKRNPVASEGKGLHGFVRASNYPTKNSQETQKDTSDVQAEAMAPEDPEWGGSQWEVRVGSRSPPVWGKGKRKAEGEVQRSPEKRCVRGDRRERAQVTMSDSYSPCGEEKGRPLESNSPTSAARTVEVMETKHLNVALRSLTRSPSPGGKGEIDIIEDLIPPSSQSRDSDGLGIGIETQELLTAHQKMLVDTRLPNHHPEAAAETQKLTNFSTPQSQLPKPKVQTVESITAIAPDVGQALVQLACKYRFVLDEVQEVYEEQECDLERTTAFFNEARQHILEKRCTWRLIAGKVPREPEESA